LLYVQRGATYNFADPEVYNIFRPVGTFERFVEIGDKEETIEISNGYLSFPITAQWQVSSKFELYGGISLDLLVNATGRGRLDFETDEFFFEQSYDFRYNGDEAGEVPFRVGRGMVFIESNGELLTLWRTQAAYYKLFENEKVGNKFNLLDGHLIFGVNYFINSGFYVGIRGQYGLGDITNENLDFSVRELNDDNTFILRNDRDRSVSAAVSFGFRF